jgi:hypothetical protein
MPDEKTPPTPPPSVVTGTVNVELKLPDVIRTALRARQPKKE